MPGARRIHGPIKKNGIWRSRYNHEIYNSYSESDQSRAVDMMGHLFRMPEQNPCRKITLHKPNKTLIYALA
jgi:hypothetical protein